MTAVLMPQDGERIRRELTTQSMASLRSALMAALRPSHEKGIVTSQSCAFPGRWAFIASIRATLREGGRFSRYLVKTPQQIHNMTI
jgi:hypothetical protein